MDLSILKAIQSTACLPLDWFFILTTCLAEQYFIVAVCCVVYWLIDKKTGECMCMASVLSTSLNGIIKNICKIERPIGKEGVRTIFSDSATGYSFPSGHSQGSAGCYFSAAFRYNKTKLYIVAAIAVFLIMLSRVYLGVHWPSDVITGALLGVAAAFISVKAMNSKHKHLYTFIVAAAALIGCLTVPSKDIVTAAGLSLGFAVGLFCENKFVCFTNDVSIKKKALRLLTGLLLVAAAYIVPKLIFADAYVFRYIRYCFVALTVTYLAPLVFKKLNI